MDFISGLMKKSWQQLKSGSMERTLTFSVLGWWYLKKLESLLKPTQPLPHPNPIPYATWPALFYSNPSPILHLSLNLLKRAETAGLKWPREQNDQLQKHRLKWTRAEIAKDRYDPCWNDQRPGFTRIVCQCQLPKYRLLVIHRGNGLYSFTVEYFFFWRAPTYQASLPHLIKEICTVS